ncbi:TonB family protein [Burkholderiales bacterium JOSHI_001]|nr:TonB family protein [Burkholderiales bacterium JOSHI_001]
MTAAALSFRQPVLPWSVSAADEQRFRRIAQQVLFACLVFGVALPWLPVFKAERGAPGEVPPVVAKLLLNRDTAPPPPPPAPTRPDKLASSKPEPVKAEAATPETPKPEAAKPQPPKPLAGKPRVLNPIPNQPAVVEARNPQPDKAPGEAAVDAARRKAAGVGLLAMKDALAELRSAPVAVQLKDNIQPGPGVGTNVGVGVGSGTEPGLPTRNLVTSNATGGSGGINTASLSRDTGGGGLAGRATTLVAGVAGGGGGGGHGGGGGGKGGSGGTADGGTGHGAGGVAGGTGNGKGGSTQRDGSGKASRSLEDVRIVFDRNKGAIYSIYNRALREDPALQGKVVVELKISPDGQVTGIRLVSSELNAQELESKLLARIRQFDFGAKDVNAMVVTYPLDFLPS